MSVITYQLDFEGGDSHTFEIDLDRNATPASSRASGSSWTALEHHQCANCPLTSGEHPACPVAVDIEQIAADHDGIRSYDRVDVTVRTEDRTFMKNCDAQHALMSLFGLIMATSRCPILARLEPLARFHLPFATLNETAMRVVGTYLIKQRALYLEGDPNPDWELHGVEEFYEELSTVNAGLMKRLSNVSSQDANGNAINIFCSIAALMKGGIDEMLDEIVPLAKGLL